MRMLALAVGKKQTCLGKMQGKPASATCAPGLLLRTSEHLGNNLKAMAYMQKCATPVSVTLTEVVILLHCCSMIALIHNIT